MLVSFVLFIFLLFVTSYWVDDISRSEMTMRVLRNEENPDLTHSVLCSYDQILCFH